MEQPVGDQLYQIFQEGFQRAASGSPSGATVLPPTPSYNGYLSNLPLIGDTEFNPSQPTHSFPQGNGWSQYPTNDIEFPPVGRANSFVPQHQQHGQLYHPNEFYGAGLELNPSIANFNHYQPVPGAPDLLGAEGFNPTAAPCIDYNSVPVPYQNSWPKQELSQPNYSAHHNLEQPEDVKAAIFNGASSQDGPNSNSYYANPPSSENLLAVSPSPSQDPVSPRSPGSSLTDSSYTDNSKRRSGGAGGKAAAGGSGRGKRKKCEEILDPSVKMLKEKDRRVSNNSRERMRIRDINDALTELGRVCMSLKPLGKANAEKPQTKLGVLNMAVDVIMQLEKKVRDRNLNPSTVALQHRGGVPPSGLSIPPIPTTSSGGSFQNPFPPMPPHQR